MNLPEQPIIARVKQDFTCKTHHYLVRKGWLIKILAFREDVDYDDFGNGDVIVLGYDTYITFEIGNITYHAAFRGQLSDMMEVLPDTPATRILFGKQGVQHESI